MNVTADKQKWSMELKRELRFAREEHKCNYEREMKAYENEIESWRGVHSKF